MRTMKIFSFVLLLASVNSFAQDVVYQTTTSGPGNTRIGVGTGNSSTLGLNTFVGTNAGFKNTIGQYNTFLGHEAGYNNTEGTDNVIIGGKWAGRSNLDGSLNVMIGRESGLNSVSGIGNSFVGYLSGSQNINGSGNSYFGPGANGKGNHNVALGALAGNNSTGSENISIGTQSGKSTASDFNIIIGTYGQYCPALTSGIQNTFFGFNSGFYFTSGAGNLYMGPESGSSSSTGNYNTFVGRLSGNGIVTGSSNTFLGRASVPSGLSDASKTGSDTNSTIILADGDGNNRMIIDNNGFAGIGLGNIARPTAILDVNGAPRFRGLQAPAIPNTFFLSVDIDGRVSRQTIGGAEWKLTGNSGTNALTNFLGTTDDKNLTFRRNNLVAGLLSPSTTVFGTVTDETQRKDSFSSLRNTYIGANAAVLFTSTAADNTIIGYGAGGSSNSAGQKNTFVGALAGLASTSPTTTSGSLANTYIGYNSGMQNRYGAGNTFIGSYSGDKIIGGNYNTFIGSVNFLTDTTISSTIILADGTGRQRFYIAPNGNAGIGLDNNTLPQNKLEIQSDATNPSLSGLRLTNLTTATTGITNNTNNKFLTVNNNGDVILQKLANADLTDTSLYKSDGAIDSMTTTAGIRTVDMNNSNIFFKSQANALNGRIYIGVSQSFPLSAPEAGHNYKLFVEGGILTEKVKVALRNPDTDWKDGVFANDYKLMRLSDIETFVKENKHLPGIESAGELVKNGLDLSDMQAKQMGKIEELTLYVIEQNKTLERQNKEIEELKEQMKILMNRK